jgi:ATP-dependent exoDNAse (exonuclease V) beta subunit
MRVTLRESDHVYLNELNQSYTPVSTVLGAYKNKFDSHQASTDYAIKHGETPEYWLKKWSEISEYACNKGTAFHNLKENFVENSAFFKHDIRLSPVRNWKQLRETKPGYTFSDLPDGTYTELTMAHHGFKIAGTADLVTILPDGWVDIDDYKTNKLIKFEGFKKQTMMSPLHEVQDCNYQHYMLQLNIYGWLLAQYGFKIRRMRLLYYDMQPNHVEDVFAGRIPDLEPQIYTLPNFVPHAGRLLEHYVTHKRKR